MNRFIHRIEAVGSKKELIALLVKAFNCKSMIEDKSERTWKQNIWAYFVSVSCNHFDDPACPKVCPTGAHVKHVELGGVVLIDQISASDAVPVRPRVLTKLLNSPRPSMRLFHSYYAKLTI